mgnify:CR=1 FL=1
MATVKLSHYVKKAPKSVSNVIDNEAVVIQPLMGKVNVLNEMGAFIWNFSDGSHTLEAIIGLIRGEYSVSQEQATADALEFVQEMVDRELLIISRA